MFMLWNNTTRTKLLKFCGAREAGVCREAPSSVRRPPIKTFIVLSNLFRTLQLPSDRGSDCSLLTWRH